MTRNGWIALFITLSVAAYPFAVIPAIAALDARFGLWAGVAGGVVALAAFLAYVRYVWRLGDRLESRERDRARGLYRGIYRVLGPPADTSGFNGFPRQVVPVGDYGWEAQPLRRNGLIYLEGLTEEWGVLWYAGFDSSQVEYVCPKPVSQYDWGTFEYAGPKPAAPYHWKHSRPLNPCPYPVEAPAPERADLNFPSIRVQKG